MNIFLVSCTGSTDPQVLAVTSAEESKRQSYIHELINTEETYMQDMSIVLEVKSCKLYFLCLHDCTVSDVKVIITKYRLV